MLVSDAITEHNGTNEITLNCPEECEGWFSSSQCDGCGSMLAGDRHPAALWTLTTKYEEIEICVDCLVWFANGDDTEIGD